MALFSKWHLGALVLLHSLTAAAVEWPDLSSPPPATGGGAKDAAVIVGIEKYIDVPPVPGATQNATDWFVYLAKTRGVSASKMTLLRDREGSLEKMKKFAAQAAEAVEPGGTLWFIFIGHGAPAKDAKDGVLVGSDAQQDVDSLYARSLPQKDLLAILSKGRQAHTVVLLDACFSGRMATGSPLISGLQPLLPVVSAANRSDKMVIATAGASDQFAGPLPGVARP